MGLGIVLLTGRLTLGFSSTLRASPTREALKFYQSMTSARSQHDVWAL